MVPASAETLTGGARIIDADTVEIAGEKLPLEGIDAPESRQTCKRDGKRHSLLPILAHLTAQALEIVDILDHRAAAVGNDHTGQHLGKGRRANIGREETRALNRNEQNVVRTGRQWRRAPVGLSSVLETAMPSVRSLLPATTKLPPPMSFRGKEMGPTAETRPRSIPISSQHSVTTWHSKSSNPYPRLHLQGPPVSPPVHSCHFQASKSPLVQTKAGMPSQDRIRLKNIFVFMVSPRLL